MKTAFMIDDTGEVVSVIVPCDTTPNAFPLGVVLCTGRVLDLSPYAIVPPETEMRVVSHNVTTGVVELAFVVPVRGMDAWDQVLTLVPFCTDDALPAFSKHVEPNCVCAVMCDREHVAAA
jgi:hypothetical protein